MLESIRAEALSYGVLIAFENLYYNPSTSCFFCSFFKMQNYKALSILSFDFVSYFDIRISNLVAARGRAS